MRDGSHKPIIVAEDLEQSEVPKSKIGCGPNASVNACHFRHRASMGPRVTISSNQMPDMIVAFIRQSLAFHAA